MVSWRCCRRLSLADPGTRWEYGISTDWLGQVIEAVSGNDLASYCSGATYSSRWGCPTLPSARATEQNGAHDGIALPDARWRTWFRTRWSCPSPNSLDWAARAPTRPDLITCASCVLCCATVSWTASGCCGPRRSSWQSATTSMGRRCRRSCIRPCPSSQTTCRRSRSAEGWGLGFHLFLEDPPRHAAERAPADWRGLFNCSYWIHRASGVTGVFLTQVLPFYDARIVETSAGFELGVDADVGALHGA